MEVLDKIAGTIVTSIIRRKRVSFFVQNEHDHIQACHFAGNFYEEEELAIIEKFFDPGSCFVDLGANVGNHTLFASLFLGAAKVIPFELNPIATRVLVTNIRLNNLQNVDTSYIGLGVSSQDCRLKLSYWEDNNWGGAVFRPDEGGVISAVSGDSILAPMPIGFIKMDIEGMEVEALRGLAVTIERWRPKMFVECRDAQFGEFMALMEAHRYSVLDTFARYIGVSNYLVVPNEKRP
jgi:FkbM family methyltransferase